MRPKDLTTALFASNVTANDPAPVSLRPGDWVGIDGNWSSVQFLVGSGLQLVNVLASTSISEFWVVGSGGCLPKESRCINARGGVYATNESTDWKSMGTYDLGLSYLDYTANGDYGLDSLIAYSPITDIGFSMSNVLTSVINTTDYFIGEFGLGITQGNFSNKIVQSPLTQAVQPFGWIPSYSYGFTAGAHYKNMPVSVTLGGTDTSRYVDHDNEFTLSQQEGIPRPLVRGIEISADSSSDKPDHWLSRTQGLSGWNTSFTAIIDSTTPYLWLPDEVCDNFATALNLTYNSTFGLYTITNEQYRQYSEPNGMTFTFSLSSFDNHDDFGYPLDIPGVVNITIPLRAFVGLLQYPFMGGAIKYGAPSVPYFTLKKSSAENATTIIGRSFLQESYLITKYDSALFSIHQAKFPGNAVADAKLMAIEQPNNSPYPGPPPSTDPKKGGLTTRQMVGIAVGVALACTSVLATWCCYRRKKRSARNKTLSVAESHKDSGSSLSSDLPKTPVARILSKISRMKRSRNMSEGGQVKLPPSEAPDAQIYELPAPLAPVELDCGRDGDSIDETEYGTDNTQHMSAYEIARRKIDRQLQGPVPEYSPPVDGSMLPPEKLGFDMDPPTQHNRNSPEELSPVTPRFTNGDSNSLPISIPSPVSPRYDWNSHSTDLPSPVTASLPAHSTLSGSRSHRSSVLASTRSGSQGHSTRRSNSNSSVPVSPPPVPVIPQASFQRTPIDPSKVVCLGPLPEHFQAPRQSMTSRSGVRDRSSGRFNAEPLPSEGSLGSNYTDDEERFVQEMTRQVSISTTRPDETTTAHSAGRRKPERIQTQNPSSLRHEASESPGSPSASSPDRIDSGMELIHVPQMAEKRYSWEEERQ